MPKQNYETMNLYQINKQQIAILLKVEAEKQLFSVWIGNIGLNRNIDEEPLALKINNRNIFFYKNGIKEITGQDLMMEKVNKEYQLTNNQKQEVLDAFAKKIDQSDLNQKIMLLELKNQSLTKENWFLKQDNIILDIKNGDLNLENSELKLETEEILVQEEPWNKEMNQLKQEIIKLQNNNKMQQQHINELVNAKDSLCRILGTSFDVHERPKEQYKNFVKQIAFVSQTFLDKFEKPKSFEHENEQFKLIKKFYDDEIESAMDKWQSFHKTPQQVKEEILKNKKPLEKINEEYQF